MTKYRRRDVVVEAFQFGYDSQPQWFIDRTMNGTSEGEVAAFRVKATGRLLKFVRGDYVVCYKDNLWVCEENWFLVLYMAIGNVEAAQEVEVGRVVTGTFVILAYLAMSTGVGFLFGAGFGWLCVAVGSFALVLVSVSLVRKKTKVDGYE